MNSIMIKIFCKKKRVLKDFYLYDFQKVFPSIVFIFIVISTMFWPICDSAFFSCLLNWGT